MNVPVRVARIIMRMIVMLIAMIVVAVSVIVVVPVVVLVVRVLEARRHGHVARRLRIQLLAEQQHQGRSEEREQRNQPDLV